MYQYKICPFCNKLKVVMDFLGIPYSITEVSMCVDYTTVTSTTCTVMMLGGGIFFASSVAVAVSRGWRGALEALGRNCTLLGFPCDSSVPRGPPRLD